MKSIVLTLTILSGLLSACQTSADNQNKADMVNEPPATQSSVAAEAASDTTQLPYINLDVAAFKEKMKEPGVVILDVRTPQETAQGMIEGAVEIDFYGENFEREIEKLDPDKTYLVYCRSGNRSGKTCKLMASKGFKHCYNLQGGYIAWSQQN